MAIPYVALCLAVLSASPGDPVRVMSYNIRNSAAPDGVNAWDNRKDYLAETIRAFDPDLLGTQETLLRQRDDLAARLDAYDVLAAGRDDGREAGEMTALFYRRARFEKLAGGHFWLSETPDRPGSKSWDSALTRMMTWVKLRDRQAPDARPIAFFNTHFDHQGPKARTESARLIRRQIEQLGDGCRIILAGDFNTGEGTEPYRVLFAETAPGTRVLLDTYRCAHPTKAPGEGTFNGFKAGNSSGPRIDWIACSPDWEVVDASIVRTARDGRTPSDHHAVIAVLRAAGGTKANGGGTR